MAKCINPKIYYFICLTLEYKSVRLENTIQILFILTTNLPWN